MPRSLSINFQPGEVGDPAGQICLYEIDDIFVRSTGRSADRGSSLLARLGIGERNRVSRAENSGDLERLASGGARIADGQRRAIGEARLLRAAEALTRTAPKSAIVTETVGRLARTDLVETTETVTVEEEVTTPAGPAMQFSFAFADPDQNAVDSSGQIRFGLRGPNVRIDVPSGGATLNELVTLVNTDTQNAGRLLASVVESEGSYRLRVETNDVGSFFRIRINRDDFGLFDSSMAQENGTDESTETVTTEQEVTGYANVVSYEDVEAKLLVEDEAFQALSEEFVASFNALRAELGTGRYGGAELIDPVRFGGRNAQADALTDLAAGLADRSTESGTSLAFYGLEAGGNGDLRLEATGFQQALAERPADAIELIASGPNSLARNLVDLLRGGTGLASEAAMEASEFVTRGRLNQIARLFPE